MRNSILAGLTLVVVAFGGQTAQAGLVGHQLDLQYLFTDPNSTCGTDPNTGTLLPCFDSHAFTIATDPNTQTVVPAVFSGDIGTGVPMRLTIGSTFIRIDDFQPTGPTHTGFFNPADFNGIVLTDLGGDLGVTSVQIDSQTNIAGLTGSDLSLGPASFSANLQNLHFSDRTFIQFDLLSNGAPLAVPEPASLALLGLGLAGAAVLRRRSIASPPWLMRYSPADAAP